MGQEVAAIRGLTSLATRDVLQDLAGAYEAKTRQRVSVTSVGGVDAAARVRSGEALDFIALARDAIDKLAAEGHVTAGSRVDVAKSGIAAAVAAGAPLPDLSSEDAVRRAVAKARTVGYSTGPSGVYLEGVFERWGIDRSRRVRAAPGVPVGTLIARGEVELGFQQMSELLGLPGIAIVGPLPPQIQLVTVFSAGVCSASSNPDATRAWLAFLAAPENAACKRRRGMEPAAYSR